MIPNSKVRAFKIHLHALPIGIWRALPLLDLLIGDEEVRGVVQHLEIINVGLCYNDGTQGSSGNQWKITPMNVKYEIWKEHWREHVLIIMAHFGDSKGNRQWVNNVGGIVFDFFESKRVHALHLLLWLIQFLEPLHNIVSLRKRTTKSTTLSAQEFKIYRKNLESVV